MNTPSESAAITFDYLLTSYNRYGLFYAKEKEAF